MPAHVLATLHEHKRRQNEQRLALGPAWQDHDLVFTVGHGGPIHPDNLKVDFDRLARVHHAWHLRARASRAAQ